MPRPNPQARTGHDAFQNYTEIYLACAEIPTGDDDDVCVCVCFSFRAPRGVQPLTGSGSLGLGHIPFLSVTLGAFAWRRRHRARPRRESNALFSSAVLIVYAAK